MPGPATKAFCVLLAQAAQKHTGGGLGGVLLWGTVLLGFVLVAYVVLRYILRAALGKGPLRSEAQELDHVERLWRQGMLSDEEYRRARRAAVGRISPKQAAEGGSPGESEAGRRQEPDGRA